MKDCCDYMENGYGMDDLPADDAYQAPQRRRPRQRDVDTNGQPLEDIRRTLGQDQLSRSTGESLAEHMARLLIPAQEG
jgi:glycosyltransferase A (GT-A) superfamily protein (DUF2064 family)